MSLKLQSADLATLAADTLANGGATRRIRDAHTPTDGVCVGRPGQGTTWEAALFTVETAVSATLRGRIFTGEACVGTWINEGTLYVDIVDRFESLADALAAGRERGELAVFDLATGTEHATGVVTFGVPC